MDNSWIKSNMSFLTSWIDKFKLSYGPTTNAILISNDEELRRLTMQKQEILIKFVTSIVGLAVTLGISFYGIKWLLNSIDPTKKDKEEAQKRAQCLMKSIGVSDVKLTEYELCIASNLVDPLSLDTEWGDIGGLQTTIEEIKETIINPFKHHKLFSSTKLVQAPKGVLFYGPPGCGKTMIAKATAKAAGARFINLQVSTLVDKWYGESQKKAEAVFSLAKKLQPTIIFIDEIDSFLRMRSSSDHEATSMMKTQFMSFWDGLATDEKNLIVVVGATNRPADVDAAILRRMPAMFKIELPDGKQRKQILEVILKNESIGEDVNFEELSQETDGWSGSDLHEMCRNAAINRVRELLKISEDSNTMIPTSLGNLMKSDFEKSISKMKQFKRISSLATIQQMAYD